MGFACEEILTNGFRFCQGNLVGEDKYAWNYVDFALFSFNNETKTFIKRQALNYENLVRQISSSTHVDLSDFIVQAQTVPEKKRINAHPSGCDRDVKS